MYHQQRQYRRVYERDFVWKRNLLRHKIFQLGVYVSHIGLNLTKIKIRTT
jgi:hypothetical protein